MKIERLGHISPTLMREVMALVCMHEEREGGREMHAMKREKEREVLDWGSASLTWVICLSPAPENSLVLLRPRLESFPIIPSILGARVNPRNHVLIAAGPESSVGDQKQPFRHYRSSQ
jgi:hypothetical protein